MALSAKINGVTYRCVNDYSIKEQSGAVSSTSINVLLGANPIPLVLQQVQLYIDGSLFFAGLVQQVGTPEYSTTYETQVFSLSVSSLECLFNMRLVTKNFYYYTYPTWTDVLNYLFTNYIAEENITLGAISTTAKSFDSKYSVQNKKLSDVLNEIADAIGNATWKITPDRKFYFLISDDFTSVTPPTKLSKLRLSENIGDLRTVQTIIGASSGINATASNDTLKATIAARTGGSGKIEIVESDASIHSDTKAATEAAARLTYYDEPVKEVSCLCHDLAASTLLNSWPLSLTIGGVAISGDFVVTERTISHQVGSKLNINVKLKNNNFFARYGYTIKGAALLASESQGAIGDQNADSRLTPLEKKSLLEEWETIADEKPGLDSDGAQYGLTALVSAYDAAFQALADYLNDGTTWTSGTPLWLDGERMTQTEEIDYTTFTALKVAYYNARTALVNGIRSGATTRLSVSSAAIVRARDDSLSPSTVTISAAKEDGTAYAGRIKIALTTNGSTWTTVYTSSTDEASKAYTVPATYSSAYVTGVRVSLYAAGGTTTLLREVTIPVALDSSTSAIYFGALSTAPTTSIIPNDHYFDNRILASGGGVIRYFTGSAWAVATSAWPYYAAARASAVDEIIAWIIDNDSASGELVAYAKALIIDLWAYDLTVGKTLRVGGRYSASGAVADSTVPGAYFDDGGTFKLGGKYGEISINPDNGAVTITGLQVEINETNVAAFTGAGDNRSGVKLGDAGLLFVNAPEGKPESVQAAIRLVNGEAIIEGEIFAPMRKGGFSTSNPINYATHTGIAYSPVSGRIIVTPQSGTSYATSDDGGVTWTVRTAAAKLVIQFWDKNLNLWLAGSAGKLMQSTDGITWSQRGTATTITKVVYNPYYKIYYYASGSTLYSSDDAITWTVKATMPLSGARIFVPIDDGVMWAFATTSSTVAYKSTNGGESWSSVSISTTARLWNDIVWAEKLGLFIITARGYQYYLTSNNGTAWTERSISYAIIGVDVCVDTGEAILFTTATTNCYVSADAITWTPVQFASSGTPTIMGGLYISEIGKAIISGYNIISTLSFVDHARIGAGIIESGEDASGNWYRIYGDGWAECGGAYGGTTATSKTADLYWYTPSSKTFPVEFAATPLLTHSASNYCRSTESGVTAAAFVVKAGRGDGGSIGTTIRWRAEGRLA